MISRNGQPEAGSTPGVRVALFTDTLGDVNGVSRFLNDIADRALENGRNLRIFTSTRKPVLDLPNLCNFRPRAACRLPGYSDLEIVLPPMRRLIRAARAFSPDVIHISTPGPVGCTGRWIAHRLGVPLAGVYHTDFPAYVEHLFDDAALTHLAGGAMRRFYKPFRKVFARSAEYHASLERLGIDRGRQIRLQPGIKIDRFHPRFRDSRIWAMSGVPAAGAKLLYAGRLSLEKNMPLLVETWQRFRRLAPRSDARLIIVGDGPYRATMESALSGLNAHFLGFRHGEELSRLYASSDLFVFPSITDTLGQVVLEAQASGLPVLVTDVGGPKEVVRHGADAPSGIVLSPRDPTLWASQALRLSENPELLASMGAAAHRHAGRFSIHASFSHFWEMHERLASDARPALRPQPPAPMTDLSPSFQMDSVSA
ncbi:MAG: glycosyltransferase family 1 protein [Planctomycetes bacterium]|nr:glycosyltransferase family 1 protein [Planctomycetota bacterium]